MPREGERETMSGADLKVGSLLRRFRSGYNLSRRVGFLLGGSAGVASVCRRPWDGWGGARVPRYSLSNAWPRFLSPRVIGPLVKLSAPWNPAAWFMGWLCVTLNCFFLSLGLHVLSKPAVSFRFAVPFLVSCVFLPFLFGVFWRWVPSSAICLVMRCDATWLLMGPRRLDASFCC